MKCTTKLNPIEFLINITILISLYILRKCCGAVVLFFNLFTCSKSFNMKVLILFILFLFTPQPHHPVYSFFALSSSFIIFGYTLLVSEHCSIVVFQQQRQNHYHKLITQQTKSYFKIETSLLDDDTETLSNSVPSE